MATEPPGGQLPARVEVLVCCERSFGQRIPARVVIRDPGATVADLADQLGAGRTWLAVDGRPCAPTSALIGSGLRRGSLVATPPGDADPPDVPAHGPFLAAETGLDSARILPLELGEVAIGEVPVTEVPVTEVPVGETTRPPETHILHVDHQGTVVDTRGGKLSPGDHLIAGSTTWVLGRGADPTPATPATPATPTTPATQGTPATQAAPAIPRAPATPELGEALHRPPRRGVPERPGPVAVPDPPEARDQKPALPIVALVTPIIFAAVMVYFLDSYIYAAFGLLGPLAAGGTYLDGRRRYRKARRGESRTSKADLDHLAAELEDQRRRELDRLHRSAGPLWALRAAAARGDSSLWERRPPHPDFLEVRLATGAVPYTPVISSRSEPSPAARQAIDAAAERGVDVASLRLGRSWVGICGDRSAALSVARAIVLQAATTSGPADLSLRTAVSGDRQLDWEWTSWLPHSAGRDDGSEDFAADRDRAAPADRDSAAPGGATAASPGRTVLWVVDGAPDWPRSPTTTGLAVAEDFYSLPDECRVVIDVDRAGVLSVEDLDAGCRVDGLLGCGVAPDVADSWARRLARYHDDDLPLGRLPESVKGTDLWPPRPPPADRLVWTIGEGPDGPVRIDLSGPDYHLVAAGVPGSGKSELIEGVVAATASYGPETIQVAVLDLAGGRLARLGAFPHVSGVATEVDQHSSTDGPLARLEGEILRRDRLIRAGGFDSLEAYRAAGGTDAAHLIVAIDDPGTIAAGAQLALESLCRLVAASGHLGVHAVLATRQPAGRAATVLQASAVRIALRLDRRSAEDLVGVAHPAGLPRSRPGRAWMQVGDHPARPLQLGSTSAPAPAAASVEVEFLGVLPNPGQPSVLDAALARARELFAEPARPLWGESAGEQTEGARSATLSELLGVGDLSLFDPASSWSAPGDSTFLAAPIGTDGYGKPLWLDLKEAAAGGMGPHGLVVGATGSGKSELLRTLVSALVARHPPDRLSLVLVDFKGGATFAGFAGLPHVAGMITNLESDLGNVDRMEAALLGELQRRQELLRRAGNLGSAQEYRERRDHQRRDHQRPDRSAGQEEMEPLPELLVIVDEFAELLEQRPEMITMFGSIGRVGRSLGIHLLLATQRLDEGRLRGLDSHLRYRVSLRTGSAAESRSVLGLPDAASLPSDPGVAYLRVDEPKLTRFRAALVSAPPERPRADGSTDADLDALTARLRGSAPATHQIWLPVLPTEVDLETLLGPVRPTPGRGAQAGGWPDPGGQKVPLGVIDRPQQQTRAPLIADFSGATGHLAVVGSPRSGKTTVLRTVALSLSSTHTPEEVHIYGLDFGGGGLQTLRALPHVGGIAHQGDEELVSRIVGQVARAVEERDRLFRQHGIHSVDQFRQMRADGRLPPVAPGERANHGDIYLLVDGWDSVRSTSEVLEDRITEIARRGLAMGVHLVVSAGRWAVLRAAIRDSILGRMELRQSDPFESLFDRRAAENVPVDAPGRGITEAGEHFLVAWPGSAGPGGLVDTIRQAWSGPPAPPVRVLPTKVALADLPAADLPAADLPGADRPGADRPIAGRGVVVGIAEPDISPLALDTIGTDQHLLVLGDGQAGKTTFLRTFLEQLCAGRTPEEVRVLLVDPRRTLIDALRTDLQFGYVGSPAAAGSEVARLRQALDNRLPGPDVTVEQLKARSWWTGPEVFLVVDDHDLVVTPNANPFLAILDLLAQASDVGFHLVVARRLAGWQRAQYEPVLQRLREIGATTVVMSGDPTEGIVAGAVRAAVRPPGRAVLVRYRQAPVAVQLAY